MVEQRVRNRIIEYLELASSYEDQVACEAAAPYVNVPYDVINQWEDWVPADPRTVNTHLSVFSEAEVRALCDFQDVLDSVTAALPNNYPKVAEVQALPAWGRLRDAARTAGETFAVRGKMPEDDEVDQ